MKVLVSYISKTVAMASLVVFIGFVGLDIVFRIIGEADNIAHDYNFLLAIWFEVLNTPSRIYEMMPLVGLIGCITGLGILANTSELTVMRSAGVSTIRLVLISMIPALFFMLAGMLIGEYVAPKAKQHAYSMRAIALKKSDGLDLKRGFWLRDGNDFILVNVAKPDGSMAGVNLFLFDDNKSLKQIRQARHALFDDKGFWVLHEVILTDFEMVNGTPKAISKKASKEMHWQTSIRPDLLLLAAAPPSQQGMHSLYTYIDYLKGQNLNSIEYELAFWEKAFYPIVMIGLVLVGISFVFGPLRQVTMGYRVFWGILTGVLFKTLQDTLAPLSIVFGFSPIVAMLAPALLAIALGFFFLARTR